VAFCQVSGDSAEEVAAQRRGSGAGIRRRAAMRDAKAHRYAAACGVSVMPNAREAHMRYAVEVILKKRYDALRGSVPRQHGGGSEWCWVKAWRARLQAGSAARNHPRRERAPLLSAHRGDAEPAAPLRHINHTAYASSNAAPKATRKRHANEFATPVA